MSTQPGEFRRLAIVGASYAGVGLASELRSLGFSGEIHLFGEEGCLPYHRTHLSKECLAGAPKPPALLRPETFFAERQINFHAGAEIVRIDRVGRTVHCANGLEYGYDRLVLATGASARALPGSASEHALTLRTAMDASILAHRLLEARRVAIIGGGLIGLEVAAAARARGLDVTVLEAAPRLMARSTYPAISERALQFHRTSGCDVRLNAQVAEVTREGVFLADGTLVIADLVLASLGSIPRVELAQNAGLACTNGIVTNGTGQTEDPLVYAIGDCALWEHAGECQRHESVAASQAQASIVAAELLGLSPRPVSPLRLWSTQGALRIQMTGPVIPTAQISTEEVDGGGLLVQAFENGRLVAVQAVNASRSFNAALQQLWQRQEEYESIKA